MKTQFTLVAYCSWLALLVVWTRGYFTSKQNAEVPRLGLQIPTSALLFLCFACLFNPSIPYLRTPITPSTTAFGAIGLALDLVGVSFAIWARLVLGRNWSGLVMTVKHGHELVQTGPYAIVRHPIYAGLLLAILGTALTLGSLASYVGFAAGLAAILIRVNVEDGMMNELFRTDHEAYRRRTWTLIPFVW
jgi:protein-S-isoprenylcysteine O-methyltransferase Ste14